MPVFFSYERFARVLKFGTLVFFVYVATAFFARVPLSAIVSGALVPSIHFSGGYLTALTAVLGTTISPYLFFWQASQEVEEQTATPGERPLRNAPEQEPAQLGKMRADTYAGMAVSNIVAFFIVVDTAALLHSQGITNIETAAQAAEALRPVGGEFAFLLFAVGIVGTGLLAIPVLAGSVGYALAELRGWPEGLERPVSRAGGFYGTIVIVTLMALALNFSSISPIKALFWSAVVNGVAAGPIMVVLMLMTTNSKLNRGIRLGTPPWLLGWASTAVMLAASAGMLANLVLG